jgi:hypothetical protein
VIVWEQVTIRARDVCSIRANGQRGAALTSISYNRQAARVKTT